MKKYSPKLNFTQKEKELSVREFQELWLKAFEMPTITPPLAYRIEDLTV